MTDLTYTTDDMFTRFYPETKDGEQAWKVISEQTEGSGAVFNFQSKSTIAQLRRAGYSVRKAKPSSIMTDDELLAELGGLSPH